MSSEMVERVAAAIADSRNLGLNGDRTDTFFIVRDYHRIAARAAISAMRDPTDAMEAAADAESERYHGNAQERLSPGLAWRAMIGFPSYTRRATDPDLIEILLRAALAKRSAISAEAITKRVE